MHEWINRIKTAIDSESIDQPVVATLATVSRNGSPRARSVICRKIGDDGEIWITSDTRSKKGKQIQQNRRIELVLWFPKIRRQYRLRGNARLVDRRDPTASTLWSELSDRTKAMFFWHSVGKQSLNASPPETFEAIAICPSRIEELDLTVEPHQVQVWRKKDDWLPSARCAG